MKTRNFLLFIFTLSLLGVSWLVLEKRTKTIKPVFATQGIINGNFETGSFADSWSAGGELNRSIVSSAQQHSGKYAALLGSPAYACDSVPVGQAWIRQSVTLSANARYLKFWYRIFSYDKSSDAQTDLFDRFEVRINGTRAMYDFNRSPNPYGCNNPINDLGWKQGVIGLSSYRGQTIVLEFRNVSYPDESYNTYTFIDDVEISDTESTQGDINSDKKVDILDYNILLSNFGK